MNERWIQFAFVNSKGKLNKTALKLPYRYELELNKEYTFALGSQEYNFGCENIELLNNNDGTYDKVYVVATNNQ